MSELRQPEHEHPRTTGRLVVRFGIVCCALAVVGVVALAVVIFFTSAPELPSPAALPSIRAQLYAVSSAGTLTAVAQADLAYTGVPQPGVSEPRCSPHGHWSLNVNPEDAIGSPYPSWPN